MIFINEQNYKDCSGIYKITNLHNGKVYIGQTSENFQRRYWHHQWCLSANQHHNTYLQNAWNKYGSESFTFEVIHILSAEENIDQLEIKYINQFNATDINSGYNMQSGGQPSNLHRFISDESRKIVGEKNRQHMLGKKLSDETRAKMRSSSRHQGPSEDGRRKISEYMSNRIVSDSTKEKLRQANTGSNSPVTKLSENDVYIIKQRIMHGDIQRVIADDYAVSLGVISAIANDRTWRHVEIDGWCDYILHKKNKYQQ